MIRAFIAFNADAYVMHKSIIDLSPSIMDDEYMQSLMSDYLIMATMDVVHKCLPPHIAMVSRKSLLADNPKSLASMAANINQKDVGNIGILANEDVLDEMDAIGMSYELVILFPHDTAVPNKFTLGKVLVDAKYCDKYWVERYQQSVSEASDLQIANYIDGMESYFNMVDSMDKRDKDAVDKIAHGVQMLNRALQRDSTDNNIMDDDYGSISSIDVDDEFDRVWETLQVAGDQMIDMTNLINSTQETVSSVLNFLKSNPSPKNVVNRVNMLSDEIDGVRHQLGLHIEELSTPVKPKRDLLLWVVLVIYIISLIVSLIN